MTIERTGPNHTPGDWRAFASAPTDRTVILVWREDAGIFTAFMSDGQDGEGCWFSTSGEDLTGDLPEVWQPFPEPPTPVELAIAERDHLRTVLREICNELYGRGFGVAGWHLNGALEPLDTWFDDNGWCEAAVAKGKGES